ncbi:MAG TPA: ABC transporter permease, partial [Lachnospiraceae bacterium]|nr:ABC transporter permease [Lachnospiraceae bacterium]
MAKYIAKRLMYMVFVFFIMSILMFGIYKMVPGDPARLLLEGSKASMKPEVYEMQYQQARERLGLDKPIPVQYVVWITNMLQGDF